MTEELKKVLEEWKNHNDEYGGGKDYTVEKNPVLKSEYNITLSRCIKLTILRMNTEYKASHGPIMTLGQGEDAMASPESDIAQLRIGFQKLQEKFSKDRDDLVNSIIQTRLTIQ